MNSKIKKMIFCSLFAAICAIFSQISIPAGFTVISLATAAFFIAGGLLGAKLGTLSIAIYIALGAVGLPVFSNFRGGISHLVGPAGGYIIGYLVGALVIGLIVQKQNKFWLYCIAMLAGIAVCYTLGTAWYIYITKNPLGVSLMSCVVPFIPGDLIKIALSAWLCRRLKPLLKL